MMLVRCWIELTKKKTGMESEIRKICTEWKKEFEYRQPQVLEEVDRRQRYSSNLIPIFRFPRRRGCVVSGWLKSFVPFAMLVDIKPVPTSWVIESSIKA